MAKKIQKDLKSLRKTMYDTVVSSSTPKSPNPSWCLQYKSSLVGDNGHTKWHEMSENLIFSKFGMLGNLITSSTSAQWLRCSISFLITSAGCSVRSLSTFLAKMVLTLHGNDDIKYNEKLFENSEHQHQVQLDSEKGLSTNLQNRIKFTEVSFQYYICGWKSWHANSQNRSCWYS